MATLDPVLNFRALMKMECNYRSSDFASELAEGFKKEVFYLGLPSLVLCLVTGYLVFFRNSIKNHY